MRSRAVETIPREPGVGLKAAIDCGFQSRLSHKPRSGCQWWMEPQPGCPSPTLTYTLPQTSETASCPGPCSLFWGPTSPPSLGGCPEEHLHACMLCLFSHGQFFATPWAVAHQAPLSMGFSRQVFWHGLPCPSPGKRVLTYLQSPGLSQHDLRVGWGRACPSSPFRFFPSWSPSQHALALFGGGVLTTQTPSPKPKFSATTVTTYGDRLLPLYFIWDKMSNSQKACY